MQEIKTVSTRFFNTSVNCYLIKSGESYILIDTGISGKRRFIEQELESYGCRPGNLKVILLTHGDQDHCGNAAYFRTKFKAKIAMHCDDSGMVMHGDMFCNRNKPNPVMKLFGPLLGLSKSNRFAPDLYIEDGNDFLRDGFDIKVIHIPGHSRGSIGFLTKDGALFCGDLLANTNKPRLWSIIDDPVAAEKSVNKILSTKINTIYPGHGKPFAVEALLTKI